MVGGGGGGRDEGDSLPHDGRDALDHGPRAAAAPTAPERQRRAVVEHLQQVLLHRPAPGGGLEGGSGLAKALGPHGQALGFRGNITHPPGTAR